jgi:putative hydrolase of the HAD superfamily
MTEAVLFDLFETLVSHFEPDWTPPARSTAERLGVSQSLYDGHWRSIEKQWEAGLLPRYEDALRAVCAAGGVRPDRRLLAELEREYVAYTARTAFAGAQPSVITMLTALRSAGLRLAVVTNANELDTAPWSDCELAPFFDVFVASHRVGLLKPDPRIYRAACEQLQVEPAHAVFVGDGGSNELFGAREAGVEPLWSTWFLDRWPEGIRPNGFASDEWRQRPSQHASPFRRVALPEQLVAALVP